MTKRDGSITLLIGHLKTKLFELQNECFRLLLIREFLNTRGSELIFLGNGYSGYWFPTQLVESRGTIWGVGLGRDSSFEYELVKRGYEFIGFEPEKECFEASKKQFHGTTAVIENYGLWDKNGLFSYTGENISIVDIFNIQQDNGVLLEIRSLWEVAKAMDLQNSDPPLILKMNIEGAEREILLRLKDDPLEFDAIIFQAEFLFHLGFKRLRKKVKAYKELRDILKSFKRMGWKIFDLSRHQITLVKPQPATQAQNPPN